MRTSKTTLITFLFDVLFIISFLSVVAMPFYIGIATAVLAETTAVLPKWFILVNLLFCIFNLLFFILIMIAKSKKIEEKIEDQ